MKNSLKSYIIGSRFEPLLRRLFSHKFSPHFTSSGQYWDQRYHLGGNSGAGSYGRLATFKAEVINDIVEQTGVQSVIELGCGDGHQLTLANYPSYIGIDVSQNAVNACKQTFSKDTTKTFYKPEDYTGQGAELALSLDVLYHLVEDEVFHKYMTDLFNLSANHVVIYASNKDEMTQNPHVRHRHFTSWVKENRPDFTLIMERPNRYPYDVSDPKNTSFADFFHFAKS